MIQQAFIDMENMFELLQEKPEVFGFFHHLLCLLALRLMVI